ncbi:hypothetical protein CVT26_004327 [Gymnopilus dilepis]|uniref:Uncharacterized protein n=1 Tax=Gymnopilus dilepis TaxID=231916 RepID=A0A409W2B5_9AGAR|nr:hypothetical protein CVT26_004327 [Gymnopilus dilepis]
MFASSLTAVETQTGQAGPILYAWIYFNLIVNTILLPLLVATFIFSRARRHPTLVNVCITWIFSGVFAILLFYANQVKRTNPSAPLCIAQAALLFGITPMWSVAIFMLFYFMAMAVRCDSRTLGGWKLLLVRLKPSPLVIFLMGFHLIRCLRRLMSLNLPSLSQPCS